MFSVLVRGFNRLVPGLLVGVFSHRNLKAAEAKHLNLDGLKGK